MKKTVYTLLIISALGVLTAAYFWSSESGQDTLLKRVMTMAFNPTVPETVDGLTVTVCGSASPLGNAPDRAQACIAVVTPDHFFLFDVGARSPSRIRSAALPSARITGVFLTHFHSDHIADLPSFALNSWIQGRASALQVYGPPGVDQVVEGFNRAYQLDRGYRSAHHGTALLPLEAAQMQAQSFTPGEIVWRDDDLTITSFPVEHPPIDPAVGYRVDYKGRSVVISGDTNAANALFEAAQNADVLFHDALSRTVLDPMIEVASELGVERMQKIMVDVIDYHADASSLPRAAKAAGIRQLVFYHMVPVPVNDLTAKMFMRNLPDDIILAQDLHTFVLPAGSTDIIVHEP